MTRRCVTCPVPLALVCILLLTALPPLALSQAIDPVPHLLITEVLYDPVGAEPGSEWAELQNPTGSPVQLTGWKLKDNNSQDALPDYTLLPGGYVVVAADAAAFRAAYPAYTGDLLDLGGPLGNGLSNTGDALLLLDATGGQVDALSYGSDPSVFAPPCPDVAEGNSLARVPPDRDTDSATDWVDQETPTPGQGSTLPTPTEAATSTATASPTPQPPTATPTVTPTVTVVSPSETPFPTGTPSVTPTPPDSWAGSVVINEIMQNPHAVSDAAGEWLEIFNPTGSPIDLNGWELRDAGTDHHTINHGGPLWLAPGGYLVLGRNADPSTNGGVEIAYRYSGFTLGNDGDEVILLDGAGREVDRVAYDGGAIFPDPTGASMQLIHPDRDNAAGANWRPAVLPWPGSRGDRGSPGAANHTAQLEGYVYEDQNGNRTRDTGEAGIPDVVLTLSDGRTTHTLASGWYAFADLAPGAYTITESQPIGYASTTPDQRAASVTLGQVSVGHNFGEQRPVTSATPTGTTVALPTATMTQISGSGSRVMFSEVLYDPWQVGVDEEWEWIELFNAGSDSVELAGWQIADSTNADTLPSYRLPPGTYLVVAANRAEFLAGNLDFGGQVIGLGNPLGNGLSNTGDALRLLAPDGRLIDALSYGDNTDIFEPPCPDVPAGQSLARVPADRDTDTAADWAVQEQPNPGLPGVQNVPTVTVTATSTNTLTPTPTDAAPWTPSVTPSPSPTVTATPTGTPGPLPVVRLNEILPRPDAVDWDGNGTVNAYDEWIELYNLEAGPIDLAGWRLDDRADGGSAPYEFPAGSTVSGHGFLVIHRSASGVALNQDADTARLLGPDGVVVDVFSYENPRRDASYSRVADGVGIWTDGYPPSPNGPNLPGEPTLTPTATPTPTASLTTTATPTATATYTATPFPNGVLLNEVLADPVTGDWDGSGVADYNDEFIELYNISDAPAQLGGWAVVDDTRAYTLPLGVVIWPHAHLLLFRAETHLSLSDYRDQVSLRRPDGVVVDVFSYGDAPGHDRSYCRVPDGSGAWTKSCYITPGSANRLLPPREEEGNPPADTGRPGAATQTVAAARLLPPDTRVTLTGNVILPPGLLARTIYIEDATGGVKVYLRKGDYPELALGGVVRVTGWTRDYHGALEISVPDPSYLTRLGAGGQPVPAVITTGELGEVHEGRLLWVSGRVVRFERQAIILDDGTGAARVYFPAELGWSRPYVHLGETWSVMGIGGQYAATEPYVGGYQVVPRFEHDLSNAPLTLPVTGGSAAE